MPKSAREQNWQCWFEGNKISMDLYLLQILGNIRWNVVWWKEERNSMSISTWTKSDAIYIDKDATLLSLCEKTLEHSYKEYTNTSVSDIKIADSSGNVLDCDLSQKVSLFYSSNGFLPSRHKFYTVLDISNVFSIMN